MSKRLRTIQALLLMASSGVLAQQQNPGTNIDQIVQEVTQQQSLDEGVNFGKGLIDGVTDRAVNTDPASIPGYAGSTGLPQTQYYENQNLTGMQTDAQTQLNSGAANEASLFTYERAQEPKLQFSQQDPILQRANQINTDALANPDTVTVQTGSCTTQDVTQTETRLETCTAWLEPTNQTCNKTLNVTVTWQDVTNCPIGTAFSEVRALHNARGWDDYVYARAYCNPGIGDNLAPVQLRATDGDPQDCTGWESAELSTDQPGEAYTGVLLRPRFTDSCTLVPAFYSGGCDAATGQCDYTVTFRELTSWTQYADSDSLCYGSAMDLAALGYTGPGDRLRSFTFLGVSPQEGYYCVARTTSVTLSFEKPNITRTPTVTDEVNNGCAFLEAQTQ